MVLANIFISSISSEKTFGVLQIVFFILWIISFALMQILTRGGSLIKPAALECCEQETEFVNPQGANALTHIAKPRHKTYFSTELRGVYLSLDPNYTM